MTITSNGRKIVAPSPVDLFEDSSAIVGLTYEFMGRSLILDTRQGDRIEAELPLPDDLAPIGGRPIIYLDQNHWSSLAKAVYEPTRVSVRERSAAERLTEMARARKVIVPLSAAHVGETCQWSNAERRYRLALTILQLSAGWQLRDTLDLRGYELRRGLAASFDLPIPEIPAPVTLQPGVLFGARVGPYTPSDGLDSDMTFATTALTETSIVIDVMLDANPVQPLEVPGWAERLQRLTNEIATGAKNGQQRRRLTRAAFVEDLPHEVLEVAKVLGITQSDALEWLAQLSEARIAEMPSLALYRELLHEKLSDPGTVWMDNDLFDMMYLSCGAAYSDHVVGERTLTSYLRRALDRLGRPINVFPRLDDLVHLLTD